MRILVDTNVLLWLVHAGHPHQSASRQAARHLRAGRHELRTVLQNLYEFWVVATRPVNQNGLGFSTSDVATQLSTLRKLFPPLRDERGILDRWESLATGLAVQGKSAHDTRLVAAMERHGLTHLLTFNVDDFKRYLSIQLLDPLQVAVFP